MLESEKAARRAKAAAMIDWYMGIGDIADPIMIDSGRKLNKPQEYISQHISWLNNLEPDSEAYRLAYYRLWELKQVIIKNNQEKQNGNSK